MGMKSRTLLIERQPSIGEKAVSILLWVFLFATFVLLFTWRQ